MQRTTPTVVEPTNVVGEATSTAEIAPPKETFLEAIVDTNYQDASTLITHIEGSQWDVNYYRQLLGEGQEPTGLSLEQNVVAQQYELIIGLEIKVDEPLSSEQVEATGEFVVTGSATLYPTIVPNVGDMLVADIGDGRMGIFQIEGLTRLSIMKQACYRVRYELKGYYNDEIRTNISDKVVKTVYFKKEFLLDGENPFLVESEVQAVEDLNDAYRNLITIYFQEFFSEEYKTFLVPNTDYTVYDMHLTKLLSRILSNEETSGLPHFTTMTCAGDINTRVTTIWDSMLKIDASLLYLVSAKDRLVAAKEFSLQPFFESVAMTGIDKVVYPKFELTHHEKVQGKSVTDLVDTGAAEDVLAAYGTPDANKIYAPNLDTFYVFSKQFYENNTATMSLLELTTMQYLNGESISVETLRILINDVSEWTPLARFYYIPVLIMLAKVTKKDI